MNFNNKKIGVWGLGVVGKSVIRYLQKFDCAITVMDRKQPSPEDLKFLAEHKTTFIDQQELSNFLEFNTYIIASPGIDTRAYQNYSHKFIAELDIFYHEFNSLHISTPLNMSEEKQVELVMVSKQTFTSDHPERSRRVSGGRRPKIIAITGTVGKTSVTHLLSELLSAAGKKVVTGGNIGTGMLDLLSECETADYVVLELSSYQLEYIKNFAPDLAIWTNLYPKHLDRHDTLENYFTAKYNLIKYQTANQQALIPVTLFNQVQEKAPQAQISTFSLEKNFANKTVETFYTLSANGEIAKINNKRIFEKILVPKKLIPEISFVENWLMIAAALDLLGLDAEVIFDHAATLSLPEHRLALVATINTIEFYNDSKSTSIMPATLAALDKLKDKKIILLLGGISDTDRKPYIPQLKNRVEHIICFGREADFLQKQCEQHSIPAIGYQTLEQAFKAAISIAQSGSTILFSPGGPSFDLFTDYKARGERFKELVLQLRHTV